MSAILNHRWEGPQDAPVLVLGNSLGTDLTIWDGCAGALATEHRLLRYDHRGQGSSPDPDEPCTIADLAGDVTALLDSYGIARAAYAGVSIGGMVGLWLAANTPTRVTALAVFCTSAHPGNPPAWEERADTVLQAHSTAPIAEAVVGRWITPAFAAARPEVRLRLLQMLRQSPPGGYARLCRAVGAFDMRGQLGQIQAPTLVVAGAQDESLGPAHSELIARAVTGANYVVIDPAGHIPMAQTPVHVAELIREHLKGSNA